jgi:hypothetical protein
MPNKSDRVGEAPDLYTIAGHEAAHAVMGWIRGLSATELTADETGGLCAGHRGRVGVETLLLVYLAGFAYEGGCGLSGPLDSTESDSDDFRIARGFLHTFPEW